MKYIKYVLFVITISLMVWFSTTLIQLTGDYNSNMKFTCLVVYIDQAFQLYPYSNQS